MFFYQIREATPLSRDWIEKAPEREMCDSLTRRVELRRSTAVRSPRKAQMGWRRVLLWENGVIQEEREVGQGGGHGLVELRNGEAINLPQLQGLTGKLNC